MCDDLHIKRINDFCCLLFKENALLLWDEAIPGFVNNIGTCIPIFVLLMVLFFMEFSGYWKSLEDMEFQGYCPTGY